MTIAVYQIQNVLRTYGRQLSRRDALARVAGLSVAAKTDEGRNPLSAEAKRQEVIGRISREIVTRIAQHGNGQGSEDEEAALKQLSQEYGQPLRMSLKDGTETFQVVDEQGGRLITLPPEESARLRERLIELTKNIVDANMVKA